MAANQEEKNKLKKYEEENKKLQNRKDMAEEAFSMPNGGCDQTLRLLSPAPSAILYLGQLMLFSGKRDIDLTQDKVTPKHIRNPQSMNATLVQLSHDCYDAFQTSHGNSQQLAKLFDYTPKKMENLFKYLVDTEMTPDEKGDFMNLEMTSLREICDQSVDLAEQTLAGFQSTFACMAEITEFVVAKHGKSALLLQQTKTEIEILANRQKDLQEEKKTQKNRFEKLDKEVKEAKDSYTEIMSKSPKLGELVLGGLTDAASSAIKNLTSPAALQSIASMAAGPAGIAANSIGGALGNLQPGAGKPAPSGYQPPSAAPAAPAAQPPGTANTDALTMFPRLQGALNQLSLVAAAQLQPQGGKAGADADAAVKAGAAAAKEAAEGVKSLRGSFEKLARDATKLSGLPLQQSFLQKTAEDVIRNIDPMVKALEAGDFQAAVAPSKTVTDFCKTKAAEAVTQAGSIVPVTGGAVLPPYTPFPPPSQQASGEGGIVQALSANWQAKMGAAKDVLTMQTQIREEQWKRCNEISDRLRETNEALARIKFEEVDFEVMLRILRQAIRVLADLKAAWSQICVFFSSLREQVVFCCNTLIPDVVNMSNLALEQTIKGRALKSMVCNNLYSAVSEANRNCLIAAFLAGKYAMISEEHLLPGLAALSGVFGLDFSKVSEVNQAQQKLIDQCNKAQRSIDTKIKEFTRDGKAALVKRNKEISAAMQFSMIQNQEHQKRAQQTVKMQQIAGEIPLPPVEDAKSFDLSPEPTLDDL